MRDDKLDAHKATMTSFCDVLSRLIDEPVVDETGPEGAYDFNLVFALEEMPGARKMMPMAGVNGKQQSAVAIPGPTIFTAVGDLGLKLERRTVPFRHLVIDEIARTPIGN